jgi:hypothetical protein
MTKSELLDRGQAREGFEGANGRLDRAMFVHKLNNPAAGAMLAVMIGIAAAFAIAKRHATDYPLGVKADRLDVKPLPGCLPVAWPYGCDWQLNAAPVPQKHSRFGRRGSHRRPFLRLLS